jgi:hypothetical protein
MVAVPGANAVTKPVDDTDATAVFDEIHGFVAAAVAVPINCDVALTHADNDPVIIGNAFTVNVTIL